MCESKTIQTRWIEVGAKRNTPRPLLLMELSVVHVGCGGGPHLSWHTRDVVEKHFRKLARLDGDTSRCWCYCHLQADDACVCPCHGGGC